MPIKGLTETRRLTRLGKVRLGIKATSQGGKEYPKAVDYFVCPPEVQSVYGGKPKSLDIIFPLEMDPAEWQWYKAYSASRGLICRGDGEAAMALIDIATGEFAKKESETTELREVICNPKECPVYKKGQCHRVMTLQFIIRGVPALGVYQLNTGSINSIINVNSTLSLISGLVGRYSMVPMKLMVVPQEVTPEGKKKTVHVLQLVVEKTVDDLIAMPTLPTARVLLPPADTEAPDDLYPDGLIAADPDTTPPQLSERPQPAQRKARAKQQAQPPAPEKEQAATGKTEGHVAYSEEPSSITRQSQERVNALLRADETGLTATKVLSRKHWSVKSTAELSEYQAQVIIAVCEGRDESDVMAP